MTQEQLIVRLTVPLDKDAAAARAWLAYLGRHAYAKQALGGTVFDYRLQTVWPHPGRGTQGASNSWLPGESVWPSVWRLCRK